MGPKKQGVLILSRRRAMRIHDLTLEPAETKLRLSARIDLEDHPSPLPRIWVDYPADASDLRPSPETFLLMGFSLAAWIGESRVVVEGPICPVLKENLEETMLLFRYWYPHVRPATIEATEGFRAMRPREPRCTGILMSGGADALGTLAHHLEAYPADHPDRIRECFHLRGAHGFDFDEAGAMIPWRVAEYDRHSERLRTLGRHAGFSLTSLATNMLALYRAQGRLAGDAAWAAAYVAPCHALSARVTDLIISSTGFGPGVVPHASHPMVEPLYSTSAVRVQHALPFVTRMEKLARIARHPEVLEALTVCLHLEEPKPGEINCGRCRKCIRTMLALLVLGKLEDASSFAKREVTADDVLAVRSLEERRFEYYEPLIEPLRRMGRDDLARAVEDLVRRQRARLSSRRRLTRRLRGRLRGRGSSRP